MQNQRELSGNRPWTAEEDETLHQQMNRTVKPNWETVARESGLNRCASSCRYRWVDHLEPRTRPDRKLTDEEKLLILEFRSQYGKNCWSKIAKNLLRGRRIIDVKNYWHGLANTAKREGRDVERHVYRKRVELVETIRAAGKFTMDYSSSIGAVAYKKLQELLPEVAGSSSSSITTPSDHDLATSSSATDAGAASCYSVEFESGRVGFSDVIGTTAEVEQVILREQFGYNPTEINNPDQQVLYSGTLVDDHGGGPTGFNQVQAAAFNTTLTETSNRGWSQMQDSAPPWNFTFVDAPQFHDAWEPNQQLVFHSEDFDDAGGHDEFNEAMAAAFRNIN